MPRHLGKSLAAVFFIMASLLVVRVLLSFGFVASAVTQTLTQSGHPTAISDLASMINGNLGPLGRFAGIVPTATASAPYVFIDVKAEIEARQGSRFMQLTQNGPMFLKVD